MGSVWTRAKSSSWVARQLTQPRGPGGQVSGICAYPFHAVRWLRAVIRRTLSPVRSYSFSVWRWSQLNRHHAAPSEPSLHISCSVPLAGSKSRGAPTLQGLLHSEELDRAANRAIPSRELVARLAGLYGGTCLRKRPVDAAIESGI